MTNNLLNEWTLSLLVPFSHFVELFPIFVTLLTNSLECIISIYLRKAHFKNLQQLPNEFIQIIVLSNHQYSTLKITLKRLHPCTFTSIIIMLQSLQLQKYQSEQQTIYMRSNRPFTGDTNDVRGAKWSAPPNLLTIPVIRSDEQMANKTDLIGGLDRSSCFVDGRPAERVCVSLGNRNRGPCY